jgi:hypothetical protein
MNTPIDIEEVLTNLGNDWPHDDSIANRVLERIESDAVSVELPRRMRMTVRAALAIAASLLVAIGLWQVMAGGNTVYARVVDAIRRSRSLHMTGTVQIDEKKAPQVVMETWYERGRGFRETVGTVVRFGNQKNFWTYEQESKTAIRSASHGIDDIVNRMLDNDFITSMAGATFERDAANDAVVNGNACRSFVLTRIENATDPQLEAGQRRLRVLLDAQSRLIRGFIEERSGNDWTVRLTMNLEYDIPVDPKMFVPEFPKDVRIVDADSVFDGFVDLKSAVHREERNGIIYAIHRAERFQGGGILVLSSVRGTSDTLKKCPPTRRPLGPGKIFVEGPAVNLDSSPQGNGFFEIQLASADHQAINIRWWIVIPRGTRPTYFEIDPGKVKLRVGFTPQGEFAKVNFTDAHGTIQNSYWDVVLDLPRKDDLPTLDTIAHGVYAEITALEAIPFRWLDMGVKDHSRQLIDPGKTTAAEFSKAVSAHIRLWQERDVEYQLEGQFNRHGKEKMDSEDWPAIGLSYELTVNDSTLAQVAKRTDLKRLYLNGTAITDRGLKHLAGLRELHTLSLSKTAVSDNGLRELRGLLNLRKLDVRDTNVTAEGAALLKGAIPKLEIEK